MNKYVELQQENKEKAIPNASVQHEGKSAVNLQDNRPKTLQQKQAAVKTAVSDVIQRQIVLGKHSDPRLTDATDRLVFTSVWSEVAKSPLITLVVSREDSQTEAWAKTKWNIDQFEAVAARFYAHPKKVSFMVSVNPADLDGLSKMQHTHSSGLIKTLKKMEKGKSNEPSPFPHTPALKEAVPAFDFSTIEGFDALPPSLQLLLLEDKPSFSRSSLLIPPPFNFDDAPGIFKEKTALGLDTVILHEMGHIIQYMNAYEETVEHYDNIMHNSPVLTDLIHTDILFAHAEGKLNSIIWTKIRMKLNALNTWLERVKGALYPNADLPPVDNIDDIMKQIQIAQHEVGLWIEYDVISNVEHPYAYEKNEPIRTRHGEEKVLGETQEIASFSHAIVPQPLSLGDVKKDMTKRAMSLSKELPLRLSIIYARASAYIPKVIDAVKEHF